MPIKGEGRFAGTWMPTFVEYKYAKALHDYRVTHDRIIDCLGGHKGKNTATTEEIRYSADDLISDLGAAWESLRYPKEEGLNEPGEPIRRPKGPAPASDEANRMLDLARDSLFWRIREVRDQMQHGGMWRFAHARGAGRTGSPVSWDLVINFMDSRDKAWGEVWVLTDGRRALRLLYELNALLDDPHELEPFTDPCEECWDDRWLTIGGLEERLKHHWVGYERESGKGRGTT